MTITANIEVHGLPFVHRNGYMVLTNDNGLLWCYGIYDSEDKADEAVREYEEHRFMVKIG